MLRSLWLAGAFNSPNRQTNRANIYDDSDKYIIKVEAPDFDKEEIDIQFEDKTLTISGNKESKLPAGFTATSPINRTLNHRFQIGSPVQEDHIDATLSDGMLTIHLLKSQKTRIPIHAT